jgi:hypothetical protein
MNFRKQVFSLMEFNIINSAKMNIMLAFVDKDLVKATTLVGGRN